MGHGLKAGSLIVVEGNAVHRFGEPDDIKCSSAVLRIQHQNFWCRIYASHDLGCECARGFGDWASCSSSPISCGSLYARGFLCNPRRCQDGLGRMFPGSTIFSQTLTTFSDYSCG